MPKGLTARSFLRIYSLRDLVSTALKHTHPPPVLLKNYSQPGTTFAGSTLLFPAFPKAAGLEGARGPAGSQRQQAGSPRHPFPCSSRERRGRTEPRLQPQARDRCQGDVPAPGKACGVSAHKGKVGTRPRPRACPCFPKWTCTVTLCPPNIASSPKHIGQH